MVGVGVGVASTVTWSWQGGNCQWLGTLQLNHEVRTQPDRHQPSKVTHSHGVRCDTQTGRGGGGSKPGVAADSPESWVYSEGGGVPPWLDLGFGFQGASGVASSVCVPSASVRCVGCRGPALVRRYCASVASGCFALGVPVSSPSESASAHVQPSTMFV